MLSSNPQDSSRPSFLDLPAELRNYIYRQWFEFTAPFFLNRPHATTRLNSIHINLHIVPPVHVLRVCRQIQQEAASVLYANSFIQSAPTLSPRGKLPVRSAANWLHQIGSHSKFLRKLIFDFPSPIFPVPAFPALYLFKSPHEFITNSTSILTHCYPSQNRHLGLGQLLKVIWAADLHIDIVFARNIKIISGDPFLSVEDAKGLRHDQVTSIEVLEPMTELNKAIYTLCQNTLLRKWSRVIHEIDIKEFSLTGSIVFWTHKFQTPEFEKHLSSTKESNPFFEMSRSFSFNDIGELQLHDSRPATLPGLPKYALENILRYTFSTPHATILDLDNWDSFQDIWGIIYTNSYLYKSYLPTILENANYDVQMTTSSTTGIFEFDKLSRLLSTHFHFQRFTLNGQPLPHNVLFGMKAKYTITLHFHLSTSKTLSNIRINATDLITATFQAHQHKTVTIILHTPRKITSHTFTIQHLRRTILPAIQRFVKVTNRDLRERYPDVWITGRGDVVELRSRGQLGRRTVNMDLQTQVYNTLWTSAETGLLGGLAPGVPGGQGEENARALYLWLRWVCVGDEP